MKKHSILYEGKAKRVFRTDNGSVLIQEFKDSATAFNGEKKGEIANKGAVNAAISTTLFKLLEEHRILTHYLTTVSESDMAIKALSMIPIEVVVRNTVAGSLAKRTGLPEGHELVQPIVELYLKNDDLGDPLLNEDHVRELHVATAEEVAELKRLGLHVNDVLSVFFKKIGIKLIDFKLEFGRDEHGKLNVADEISPDTCRLWDSKTGEKLDKDRFRFDLGKVDEAYQEILNRVTSKKK